MAQPAASGPRSPPFPAPSVHTGGVRRYPDAIVEPAPPSGEVVDGEHRLGVRVYYEDTDFTGVVYHANYLRFMERGRSEFLRLVDGGETPGTSLFAVVRMEIDFRAPAKIHVALMVRTRLAAVRGVQKVEPAGVNRWRLTCDHDVRPEAAAAVVAGGGRLLRLSVEEPSLEAIYTRYFQTHEGERHAT